MSKILQVLAKNKMSLIVSLPQNSPELAKAAVEGGADILKVHINVHHDASGTHFGSFEQERNNLAAILEIAGERPVGIVSGAAEVASKEDMLAINEMGIDFFDLYIDHMPAWMWSLPDYTKMAAIHRVEDVKLAVELRSLGLDILEAAIVPHDGYGKALNMEDIAKYRILVESLDCPVIVPTQKKIMPEEVNLLKKIGIKALMIGAIVTGKDAGSIKNAAGVYKQVIK